MTDDSVSQRHRGESAGSKPQESKGKKKTKLDTLGGRVGGTGVPYFGGGRNPTGVYLALLTDPEEKRGGDHRNLASWQTLSRERRYLSLKKLKERCQRGKKAR